MKIIDRLLCRKAKPYTVELFVNVAGAYQWRVRHRNAQPLATSEAYTTRREAVETAENIARSWGVPFVEIVGDLHVRLA